MTSDARARLTNARGGAKRRRWLAGAVGLLLITLMLVQRTGTGEPDSVGGPPMVRRLTEAQYRSTIADTFSPDIPVNGRFEAPARAQGLISVGTSTAGMSPFAVEQYDTAAQGIAAAVLEPKNRRRFLPCPIKNPRTFDDKCARRFLTEKGRLLFRRPLTKLESEKYVGLARTSTAQIGEFAKGLELGLYAMLVSPEFLFRIERAAPAKEGALTELDAYSKASRLSFFLTNSAPDAELLEAAANGDLDSGWGLSSQVNRLMTSPRYEGAVRAFFADMMQFDKFSTLSKDPAIYPAFNSELAADAQEQTLRTITNHVLKVEGDYRDLFTTRDTFLTRSLGIVYQTPVATRGGWEAARFSEGSRREGIQSHISFLALHSHPARSSPTLRGLAMRQVFLCQEVPDPPSNVDFTAIERGAHSKKSTARDRLSLHASEPSCAGCHKVMDPPGLTMERYDGLGRYRTMENGASINAKGSLDGMGFDSSEGLALALRNHPEAPRCVAERLYKSAVGRDIMWRERYYLDWLNEGFAEDEYRIPALMRRIALSDNFFVITQPKLTTPQERIVKSSRNKDSKL